MAHAQVPDARVYSRRQVGVCGSSKGLSPLAADFCRAIGRRLAAYPNLTVISGGTKQRKSALGTNDFAADWLVVNAAEAAIPHDEIDERVSTFAKVEDGSQSTRFSVGSTLRAKGRTSEARRISFVRHLDALIAVGGGDGTRQELALALEFGLKVLPIPGVPGASADMWTAYRDELMPMLRIDSCRAERWERAVASDALDSALAGDMVGALLESLPSRCFVIMPYRGDFDAVYDLIQAAVAEIGDVAIRVDRVGLPGNVAIQIEAGLRTCDYAVAVLDQCRPNVLYELGIAHARGKPVILMNRKGGLDSDRVPFDIYTHQRIEYSTLDDRLRTTLARMAGTVSAGSRRR